MKIFHGNHKTMKNRNHKAIRKSISMLGHKGAGKTVFFSCLNNLYFYDTNKSGLKMYYNPEYAQNNGKPLTDVFIDLTRDNAWPHGTDIFNSSTFHVAYRHYEKEEELELKNDPNISKTNLDIPYLFDMEWIDYKGALLDNPTSFKNKEKKDLFNRLSDSSVILVFIDSSYLAEHKQLGVDTQNYINILYQITKPSVNILFVLTKWNNPITRKLDPKPSAMYKIISRGFSELIDKKTKDSNWTFDYIYVDCGAKVNCNNAREDTLIEPFQIEDAFNYCMFKALTCTEEDVQLNNSKAAEHIDGAINSKSTVQKFQYGFLHPIKFVNHVYYDGKRTYNLSILGSLEKPLKKLEISYSNVTSQKELD